MIFEEAEKLLKIVRTDDVKAFGKMASPELFASVFGRFPLLSMLYLFSAGRIVKRYLPDILKERPRTRYDRIPEADALFVKKAGKALRHYTNKEVSPLEMLAVLGKGRVLKKLYAIYPAADRYLNAIHAVYYTRLGEGVVRKGNTLILPKEPLGFLQKKMLRIASIVLAGLFVLTLTVSLAVPLYYGFGTGSSPYLVRNEKDLAAHLTASGAVAALQKDITLSETADTVSAEILGNDKIIRLSAPFADTFTGILRNVTFVLEEGYPAAAVIGTNRGKLENVSVVTADATYDKSSFTGTLSEEEEVAEENRTHAFSLLTGVNKGIIEGCTAVVTLDFVGQTGGNSYFAPFVIENHGTVRACRSEGSASSAAVDMAGIVAINHTDGAVLDCGSAMTLTQRTTIEGWNPNVAGIAAENRGTISACANSGAITAIIELTSLGEGSKAAGAYASGITNANVGTIVGCTNDGEITAFGDHGYAFAAGIVAQNTYTNDGSKLGSVSGSSGRAKVSATSLTNNAFAGGIAARNEGRCTITGCRQTAGVRAEAPDATAENRDVFATAGGICGYAIGSVASSFYTGTLAPCTDNEYVGAVCGLTHLYVTIYFGRYNYEVYLSEDAYLAGEGDSYAIGAVIYNNSILRPSDLSADNGLYLLDLGATKVSTLEELKALEIYFE